MWCLITGGQTFTSADVPDWLMRLSRINACSDEDHSLLASLSLAVAGVVPGAWSVDWLWARRPGERRFRWWLIDMAHAERSFVWADHPCIGDAGRFSR